MARAQTTSHLYGCERAGCKEIAVAQIEEWENEPRLIGWVWRWVCRGHLPVSPRRVRMARWQ